MSDVDFDAVPDHLNIDLGLNEIAGYLKVLHGYISEQQKELDGIAHSLAERDEWGDRVEPYIPGRFEMHSFARILCSTTVQAICTYAEVQLVSLAQEDFMRRQKKAFPIRSKRREESEKQLTKFEQAEKYWKDNHLTYTQSAAWFEFKRLKQIRNCLAHSDGGLGDDRRSEEIRSYVKARGGKPGLTVNGAQLLVEADFCDEARIIIRNLLVEVSAGIP